MSSVLGHYQAAAASVSRDMAMDVTIAQSNLDAANYTISGTLGQAAIIGALMPVAGAPNAFHAGLQVTNPGAPLYAGLAYFRNTTPPQLVLMTDDSRSTPAPASTAIQQISAILTADQSVP